MPRPAITLFGSFLMLWAAAGAAADPITFRENVSGDLGQLPAPTVFALDIGVNTVSGSIHFAPDQSSDFDGFSFAVPRGSRLTRIDYGFSLVTQPPLTSADVSYFLVPGNAFHTVLEPLAAETINLLGDRSVALFTTVLPLRGGVFGLSPSSQGKSHQEGGWVADYTWSLVVDQTPIPEPASLLLLGAAGVGFAARRRRRAGTAVR